MTEELENNIVVFNLKKNIDKDLNVIQSIKEEIYYILFEKMQRDLYL